MGQENRTHGDFVDWVQLKPARSVQVRQSAGGGGRSRSSSRASRACASWQLRAAGCVGRTDNRRDEPVGEELSDKSLMKENMK